MFTKKNFFTSGWDFDESESDVKSKFQMVNIAIILSSLGLVFGIFGNIIQGTFEIIPIEITLIIVNVILFFVLRGCRKSFKIVAFIVTFQFTLLFLFLLYTNSIDSLKFIWIFTYPVILLYLQNEKYAKYWFLFMLFMIMVAPLQPFVEVAFSLFQVIYLSFVLIIISVIIGFYQKKMDEAKGLILKQQVLLESTVNELKEQETLLGIQSKRAVMGEMISMIAHQWRQPLSTVTLSISNLQVQKLLGEEIEDEVLDKALSDISDTVVYLSETIDDFKTYFSPNKELSSVKIEDIVKKVINFALPRLKGSKIELEFDFQSEEEIRTYSNELIQVILNILNNAVDELIILNEDNAKITLSVVDLGNSYKLSIQDNARGIKKELLDSIFEPYYSTKGKNGTGLGLYMSQMIMQKQFNSKIEVSSSNKGSIFSILVPKKLT
ncbi:MAG: HAMP domain-containing sensor histidine kinase [Campylobacterota bacterium]|nr:HAMP domain-containing sensor histidine kinase [Campylobacterota bacterium]